jgi:hypothetical protein
MKSKANPRHVFFLSVVFACGLALAIFSTACQKIASFGGAGRDPCAGVQPNQNMNVSVNLVTGPIPETVCVSEGYAVTWRNPANFQVHFDASPFGNTPAANPAYPFCPSTSPDPAADFCSKELSLESPPVAGAAERHPPNCGDKCYKYTVTIIGGPTFDPHVIVHP